MCPSYLQNQQEVLRIQIENTRLGPAFVKALRRLWDGLLTKLDVLTVVNTFLVYRIGRSCFSFHWTLACLGIAIFQSPRQFWTVLQGQQATTFNAPMTTSSAPFLSLLTCMKVTWSVLCWIYAHGCAHGLSYLLGWTSWQSILMMVIPVLILMGCRRIVEFSVAVPVFVWSWASVTLIYYPIQILEQTVLQWIWRRHGAVLRKRPGMAQTSILFSILVLSAFAEKCQQLPLFWSQNLTDQTLYY